MGYAERMAAQSEPVLLTADRFLRIEWGSDIKAELEDGVIRMLAGSTRAHARVRMNLMAHLGRELRGSAFRPYGSELAIRTHSTSVRYPDISVDRGSDTSADDEDRTLSDPCVVIEVLSPDTRREDEGVKLDEYRRLPGVDTIAFVDPVVERLRVLQRMGPDDWSDRTHRAPADLALPALGVTVPHAEIFARD